MSAPSPATPTPPRRSFDPSAWKPARRTLLWVLLAFVAGLLVFALVWNRGRGDFYRSGPLPPTASGPDYAPLPAPLPAGSGNASGLESVPAAPGNINERPRVVESPRPPPPIPVAPPRPATTPVMAASQPAPLPGQSPAPSYPTQALRRRERGTVMVQADIGADGVPTSVSVAQGSGSRLLDRAATDAVRRWRFLPAQANGQATTGRVMVPIEFNPGE